MGGPSPLWTVSLQGRGVLREGLTGVLGGRGQISESVLRKKERKGGMGTSSILFSESKEKTTWLRFK